MSDQIQMCCIDLCSKFGLPVFLQVLPYKYKIYDQL